MKRIFKGFYFPLDYTVDTERLAKTVKNIKIKQTNSGYLIKYAGICLIEVDIFKRIVQIQDPWLLNRDWAESVYNTLFERLSQDVRVKWSNTSKRLELI
jgi:hypothetical protein